MIRGVLIGLCIPCLTVIQSAFGELPFSLSIETKGGYMFTGETPFFENEVILEKEINVLKGLTLGLENLVGGDIVEDTEIADEITMGIGFGILDFLSVGVASKTFIEYGSAAFGIDGIVALEFEIENADLSIADENEFLYNFTDKAFEYVNTLEIDKAFPLNDGLEFFLVLENELVLSEAVENGLLIGPGITYGILSVYVNYVLAVTDELSHGTEAGFVLEF